MDTEFPRVIYHYPELHRSSLSPCQNYSIVKKNVNDMKLIQLGLTLFDPQVSRTGVDEDLQNPKSITLFKRQGIDFFINKLIGISFVDYVFLFMASRISIATRWLGRNRTWITFHGTYDFEFLVKILSQQNLPHDLSQFMQLVYGGLERVAKSSNVERIVEKSHQASSDRLLVMQSFMELQKTYFDGPTKELLNAFNYKLHGLATA
ncbi:probable CCR4-associated factor 1 homolog 11 [Olea europaea subsp. europaea]|uniref:Probable CCR4-associated factor 1 homolog 11 n=1 Tax=Olea europaea subsp. europaea TaxID=158383 RepID=A0A8S0QJZ9_OLEEU|nr:probable CCR4-associated factor 1 homolog 11 [Olea europaea subsp. europaea]